MSMEDIFPTGSYTCVKCGATNKAREYFAYAGLLSMDRLCADCKKREDKEQQDKQRALYVSGEEEPNYTEEITCPYCGHEERDSWEKADEEDEFKCGHCGKKYSYWRHTVITYCSQRLE